MSVYCGFNCAVFQICSFIVDIIEEENNQVLELVDKIMIQSSQYFPIYGFSLIDSKIKRTEQLKKQQKEKLKAIYDLVKTRYNVTENSLDDILQNDNYAMTYKNEVIAYALMEKKILPEEVEPYLKEMSNSRGTTTDYRRLLCAYDYVKYSDYDSSERFN